MAERRARMDAANIGQAPEMVIVGQGGGGVRGTANMGPDYVTYNMNVYLQVQEWCFTSARNEKSQARLATTWERTSHSTGRKNTKARPRGSCNGVHHFSQDSTFVRDSQRKITCTSELGRGPSPQPRRTVQRCRSACTQYR